MGRVRSATVKRAARKMVERYYNILTHDFDTNKMLVDEYAICPSKKMRNKVAGYVTHLMKRIEKGQKINGISLKIQEQEKERRLDFTPDVSEVDRIIRGGIRVKPQVLGMLKRIGHRRLPRVALEKPQRPQFRRFRNDY